MFNRSSTLVVIAALASLTASCASTVAPAWIDSRNGGGDAGIFGDAHRVCVLSTGGTCEVGHICNSGPCNTCNCQPDGTCQWNGCSADASVDAAPTSACLTDAQCGPNESCLFTTAGCDVAGHCGQFMECFATIAFCGCDGTIFRECPGNATHPWLPPVVCTPRPPVFQCDPSRIGCGGIDPPVCPAGQIASVAGTCWGPCVDFAACAAIPCGDLVDNCPSGMHCPLSTDGGEPTCVPD